MTLALFEAVRFFPIVWPFFRLLFILGTWVIRACINKLWWFWCFYRLIWFGWLWCYFRLWVFLTHFPAFVAGFFFIAWPWCFFRPLFCLAWAIDKLLVTLALFRLIWFGWLWCFFRLWSLPGLFAASFVEINNLHFIHIIFLISLQGLFMSSFLFFIKVSALFHVVITCLNIFPFLQYDGTCLRDRTPCNSFLIFQMSLQNRLYAVFFDGTSGVFAFRGFNLMTLHTLNAFWMKLSLSSFPPVNSQSVLKIFACLSLTFFYQWKTLNPHQWGRHKFFMIPSSS